MNVMNIFILVTIVVCGAIFSVIGIIVFYNGWSDRDYVGRHNGVRFILLGFFMVYIGGTVLMKIGAI